MRPLLHPEIVMVFPGFGGRISGRDAFLDGFVDFCENAHLLSFQEDEHQVDRFGEAAIASFRFDMVYEREGARYRSTGRDLWAFSRHAGEWLACWRTMIDVREEPA